MIKTIYIIWGNNTPVAAYTDEETAKKEIEKRKKAAGDIFDFYCEPAPLIERKEEKNGTN